MMYELNASLCANALQLDREDVFLANSKPRRMSNRSLLLQTLISSFKTFLRLC